MTIKTRSSGLLGTTTAFAAALLGGLLAACGGGSGSMNTTAPTSGGVGAASLAVGAITGFGSVHVNGVKFETTSASISINGQTGTQASLKVGQVIQVRSHHDSATGSEVADQIDFHDNVQGPISALDTTAGTLTVLGQSVTVNANTSFGDGITPASLAGLAKDQVVEVSGMVAADGSILASRIELAGAGASYFVIGTESATNATAKTFKINGLTVNFGTAGTILEGFPASGPADGNLVRASGATLDVNGALNATKVELRTGANLKGDADGASEVEGLITAFKDATSFTVGTQPVITNGSTTFKGGASTALALNVHVEVEGTLDSSGRLVASRVNIETESADNVLLVGQADTMTATSVTVLGVTVSTTSMTHFEDRSSMQLGTFSLTDVHTGDWLAIRGSESPAGSNAVVATRFERINARKQVAIAGTVKSAAQPDFTILSVTIATTNTTDLRASTESKLTSPPLDFFKNLVGQRAGAIGSWDGKVLTASVAARGVLPGCETEH